MTLSNPPNLRMDFFVYPGQPLVSAACIVQLYRKVEDAAEKTAHGYSEAEGNRGVPGAGGQASKAVQALMGFRSHGSIDQVIKDLHTGWRHTVHPGNFDDAFDPGQAKAEELEPELREALKAWFKTRHRHMWRDSKFGASPFTTGASGRGRTVAVNRVCPCGAEKVREFDHQARSSKWVYTSRGGPSEQ